jgi:tripartite-type tricarboxylate transporter receptor subunit TctC
MRRRSLPVGAGAAALPGLLHAQPSWPSQPFKIVVPYPLGGLTDVLGRLVGERLQAGLGQPAVIDNKPGAATQLAPPTSPGRRRMAVPCCWRLSARSASRWRSMPGR